MGKLCVEIAILPFSSDGDGKSNYDDFYSDLLRQDMGGFDEDRWFHEKKKNNYTLNIIFLLDTSRG